MTGLLLAPFVVVAIEGVAGSSFDSFVRFVVVVVDEEEDDDDEEEAVELLAALLGDILLLLGPFVCGFSAESSIFMFIFVVSFKEDLFGDMSSALIIFEPGSALIVS